MRTHVLYQLGRAHKAGERFPKRDVDSLWRGTEAGGSGNVQVIGGDSAAAPGQSPGQGMGTGTGGGAAQGQEEGWRVRAMARVPGHDKVRPSTHAG
jgi:hypothetical protein